MREVTAVSRVLGNLATAMANLEQWEVGRNTNKPYTDAEIAFGLIFGVGPFLPIVAAILGRNAGAIQLLGRIAICDAETYWEHDERPDTKFHLQVRTVAFRLGMRTDITPAEPVAAA